MRPVIRKKGWTVMMLLLLIAGASGQGTDISGQLSAWLTGQRTGSSAGQAGLRFIPELFRQQPLSANRSLDLNISVNTYGNILAETKNRPEATGQIKAYRWWIRYAGSQFSVRLGLQKINFGSALLLRPLMWFDRLDPRDPLQLTEGVYALLGRTYFLNNANLWLWGIYGSGHTKGWEFVPSETQTAGFGGRFQYPIGPGELAATFHRRLVSGRRLQELGATVSEVHVPEYRYALDGKWDLGVGLWFEAALTEFRSDPFPQRVTRMLTLGGDYTFALGNGVHLLAEQLFLVYAENPLGAGRQINLTALMADYPLGLLDRLLAIVYFHQEDRQFFRFLSWQRNYDNWSWYVNLYWNPEQIRELRGTFSDSGYGQGKGVQFLAAFNF